MNVPVISGGFYRWCIILFISMSTISYRMLLPEKKRFVRRTLEGYTPQHPPGAPADMLKTAIIAVFSPTGFSAFTEVPFVPSVE
jgi:hypothetical protein